MPDFVFLEDEATADVAFIAYGRSKADKIANACKALTEVMVDSSEINSVTSFEKDFKAEDLLGLVYDVLNYLLFIFDTEELFFNEFHIKLNEEDFKLNLKATGEHYNLKKHQIKTHIKAVTFFGMVFDNTGLKVTLDL